jgi:hypothetical protein
MPNDDEQQPIQDAENDWDADDENYNDINKFIAGIVLGMLLMIGTYNVPYHPQKHTGPITVVGYNFSNEYIMWRPNNEVFMMKFDTDVDFCFGPLDDITYTDVDANVRHFIKATLHVDTTRK